MTSVWMDITMSRLRNYFSQAMETSTYFDFMTLFRRILADKTLMDFKYMVLEGHDKEPGEPSVMIPRLQKLDLAFGKLDQVVSLQEMAGSTYQIHAEDDHVTFMEFFWVYMVWMMFASNSIVTPPLVIQVMESYREAINKGMDPHLVALRTRLTGPDGEDGDAMDLTVTMLSDVDKTLTTVWESSSRPPPAEPGTWTMAIH